MRQWRLMTAAATIGATAVAVAQVPIAVDRAATGDAPADPGPLATDVSAKLDVKGHQRCDAESWRLAVEGGRGQVQSSNGPTPRCTTACWLRPKRRGIRRIAMPCCSSPKPGTGACWTSAFPTRTIWRSGQAYLDLYLSEPVDKRNTDWVKNTKMNLDKLLAAPGRPEQGPVVVERCAVYGAARARAHVPDHRRSRLPDLHG